MGETPIPPGPAGRSRVRWSTVLAEPRSTAPPCLTSRRRCFLPLAELATRPLTSPVTTLGGSNPAGCEGETPHSRPTQIPYASSRQARICHRLVKDDGFYRAGTPSIDECSLPRARPALARLARGITRSPPPVSLLACWWLSPPRPGFRRLFTGGARPRERVSQPARPGLLGPDRAPLVDFCNQHDPRARPRDHLIPAPRTRTRPACARALRLPRPPVSLSPRDLPRGEAEASPDDRSLHWARAAPSAWGARPRPRPSTDGDQPRFHGPGAGPDGDPEGARLHPAASTGPAGTTGGFRLRRLAPVGPCGPPGGRATPTRSTRTPLVMRPWPRRLEIPAWPASLPSGSDAADDPTARDPSPAKGRIPRALDDPLARGRLRGSPLRLATGAKGRRRDVSLARTHPGPGPHPSCFREEARGLPHPRCLPSAIQRCPRCDRSRTANSPGGTSRLRAGAFSTACCQTVENTRRLLQTHWIRRS
jgi:hypothetical protein